VQSGVAFSLAQLDYARVETWLSRLIELDPKSDYALLLATHVYAQVNDPLRSRQMLDFAYRHYREDPARRWRWIAHASIMARHRLHDLPLALHYARALALAPDTARIPAWAQQMQVFLHEALGESEAALALLGGLLDTGRVQDPHEIHFLMEQAERLRSAERSTSTSAGIDLARKRLGLRRFALLHQSLCIWHNHTQRRSSGRDDRRLEPTNRQREEIHASRSSRLYLDRDRHRAGDHRSVTRWCAEGPGADHWRARAQPDRAAG